LKNCNQQSSGVCPTLASSIPKKIPANPALRTPQTRASLRKVQSLPEKDFAARLHACFQGLSRATGGDVVTLAVLADLQPD
jgi:hypothetical protein